MSDRTDTSRELCYYNHFVNVNLNCYKTYVLYTVISIGSDVDGQTSSTISANWEVNDPESGVEFCEWSAGMLNLNYI